MDSEISSSELLDIVSRLQTGLEVPKALLSTAKLLRDAPSNKPLPNQQARAKCFIRFVFEETARGKDRQRRLRNLDRKSLEYCSTQVKEASYVASDPETEVSQGLLNGARNQDELQR